MKKNNDERILKMKEQIYNKKKELVSARRFSPITNCIVALEGHETVNINVASPKILEEIAVKLYIRKQARLDLGFGEYELCGYHVDDWINDIQERLYQINLIEEKNKLKQLESKLEKLLSEDKKVELELDDIESQL